ncbi:formate/nitrite transporter family protein [Paenibacillus hunanensis]|uniref:formate/nitrite transporter family protein n=1 Tax=Paenibacillus hunanensis TaxID=539262 RepID=UPI002026B99F|nr:formate/nitrite transporter family protein [Paenibacillus hunanensis]MCL9661782.1 formate/nitrite transporter family protein [Paenibacillus hunanensis]
MAYYKPQQIALNTIDTGVTKARSSWTQMLVLGFLAGAFIALGFLLDIRVIASMPEEWGSFANFVGASLFPVGLVLVLVAGGELLTGNMMAVPLARMAGRIRTLEVVRNLFAITIANLLGALFVAYFFGHVVGMTETGPYLAKTVEMAGHKLEGSFLQMFISGIGCNWLVALAVWLSYSADNISGKVLGIWFPTMAFVAIGFQHVVANMFLIPAAIFAGYYSWGQYAMNFVPVWLGNLTGGALFVACAYFTAYIRPMRAGTTTASPADHTNHTTQPEPAVQPGTGAAVALPLQHSEQAHG